MNKLTEWVKSHKPHTAGIIVAIVAVIALSVAVATGVFSNKTADTASNEPTVTAEVPVNTKKTPVTINVTADDKVTEKDVKEITDATKTAIENGDDSLKGDAGKAILGKVEANTKANTHLSDDAKATVAESTDKAQASTETEAKTTVTEAPKSASKPTERGKTWVPEKGHWEKTTKKVWVPNVVTVQDSEEQTVLVETTTVFWYGSHKWETETIKKNISTGKYIQSGTNLLGRWCRSEDGQIYPLRRNYDHLMAEFPEVILSEDENGHAMEVSDHWIRTGYETIPGQSHTEDRGHYETKVTGKRWVVDQAGHYE